MIQFMAYLNDQDIDYYGGEESFLVHSCGRYALEKTKKLLVNRPNGRKDYQIIYIYRGKGHFFFQGEEYVLEEGTIVIYYPDEPQKYDFYLSEHAVFYWMHFSGNEVLSILKEANLEKKIIEIGQRTVISQIYDAVIRELMLKRPGYKEVANLKGRELIWMLSRASDEIEQSADKSTNDRMEGIIEKINLEYDKQMTVEELAAEYGTSVSWFIKEFRTFTGYTPRQYITYIRLSRAKELLESTNYPIKEIAYMCGFENPLYFSRIFQEHYEMSPSAFRKKNTL